MGGDSNAFVTLTSRARRGMSYEQAEKAFGTFAHSLKCHLFSAKSKKRIHMVPVVEGYSRQPGLAAKLGLREGTHIHCLMTLPGDPMAYMDVVAGLWRSSNSVCGDPAVYCPNSNNWFLELNTTEVRQIYVNYALKTCTTDTDAVLWDFVPIRHST